MARGPVTGDRVTPRGLPGTLQRDAGGEVAVGSLLPLARQPVVAEGQDAAEVEGLRRRVWERAVGKSLSEAPVLAAQEPQPALCPAAQSPAATPLLPKPARPRSLPAGHRCAGTWLGTAPQQPPSAIGPGRCSCPSGFAQLARGRHASRGGDVQTPVPGCTSVRCTRAHTGDPQQQQTYSPP